VFHVYTCRVLISCGTLIFDARGMFEVTEDRYTPGQSCDLQIESLTFLSATLPYGVLTLKSDKFIAMEARLSPCVRAPAIRRKCTQKPSTN
jgi:hypothetical protein